MVLSVDGASRPFYPRWPSEGQTWTFSAAIGADLPDAPSATSAAARSFGS
jgi:hypothetical protein